MKYKDALKIDRTLRSNNYKILKAIAYVSA
jgi:hypothetical protein